MNKWQMEYLIDDILRQRKLLLWRKIVDNFPIEQKHRDLITKKFLQPPVVDSQRHTAPPKSAVQPDSTPTALHCSGTDK